MFFLLGFLSPIITKPSPTATSVTITWTQPEFSLPVTNYTVTVTQVRNSNQVLCRFFVEEDKSATTPSSIKNTTIIGLQAFSSYIVTVTADFRPAFSLPFPTGMKSCNIFTLSAGKQRLPQTIIMQGPLGVAISMHTKKKKAEE